VDRLVIKTMAEEWPEAQISGGKPHFRPVEPPSHRYGVPWDNAFHPCEADFQKHRAYPVERSENICGKLAA